MSENEITPAWLERFSERAGAIAEKCLAWRSRRLAAISANDVVQEALLKLIRSGKLAELETDLDRMKYAIHAVQSVIVDQMRSANSQKRGGRLAAAMELPEECAAESAGFGVPSLVLQHEVSDKLEELFSPGSPEYTALQMHFWFDLTFEEIGRNLGCSESQARKLHKKAIARVVAKFDN
jgi:RNA polymerase sigma factor (sigma-70 family)